MDPVNQPVSPLSPEHHGHNVWHSVSMLLLGAIVGFGVATLGGFGSGNPVANTPPPPSSAGTNPPPPVALASDIPPIADTDHVFGNPQAKVVLFVCSDYQCPYCKRHHTETIIKLREEFKDTLAIVYRQFPLTSIHPNAQALAEMSECVAEQAGNLGFEKYTDAIFAGDIANSAASGLLNAVLPIAKTAGVKDIEKFKDCVSTHKYAQKITDDTNGCALAGVRGTPGSVVYNTATKEGVLISGARAYDQFKTEIEKAIAQ